MNDFKLSIITINYNNSYGLEKTIQSICNQTCKDFEYIIIDGGSSDGSVDVIKNNIDCVDFWISESDKGVYNAMNKGITHSHGKYLLFLNSGDWLYNENVIEDFIKKDYNKALVVGNLYFYHGKDNIEKAEKSFLKPGFSFSDIYNGTLPHPATFIRRDIIKDGYNENYKIISDWIFFFEFIRNHNDIYSDIIFIDNPISYFSMDGISNKNIDLSINERQDYLKSHLSLAIQRDMEFLNKESILLIIINRIRASYLFKLYKKYSNR